MSRQRGIHVRLSFNMSGKRLTFLLLGGVLLGLLSSRIIQQYQSFPVLWSSNIFYGKQTQLSQAATHINASRVDDHPVSIVSVDPLVLYIQNFVTAEEASSLIKLVSVHPIYSRCPRIALTPLLLTAKAPSNHPKSGPTMATKAKSSKKYATPTGHRPTSPNQSSKPYAHVQKAFKASTTQEMWNR